MLEYIKQWIVNIISLVLFIVILEMLIPKGKMRKYVGLVTGVILIIAIINPLLGLFGKKFDFVAAQTVSGKMLGKTQAVYDIKLLENEQMEQIVEVYRLNIIEQIEHNAREVEGVKEARADIIFNENCDSAGFGEIRRVYLEITADGANGDIVKDDGTISDGREKKNKIEKVKIGRIGDVETNGIKPVPEDISPELRKTIADRISGIFGVSEDDIIITRQ
ncbi:MAG: stage III sporulation protein AF [Acetivibrionales bacterium]|jgi:stage III sporulation protein AF